MQASSRAHRPPGGDHLAGWWSNRIFNDRELDHGILMILLAGWIAAFHDSLGASTWWAEVFHVLPPAIWFVMLGGVGVARIYFSRFGRDRRLASAALVSCALFGFMGFLVGIVRYQMSVTPLFFWLSYQSGKSYLRLIYKARLTE